MLPSHTHDLTNKQVCKVFQHHSTLFHTLVHFKYVLQSVFLLQSRRHSGEPAPRINGKRNRTHMKLWVLAYRRNSNHDQSKFLIFGLTKIWAHLLFKPLWIARIVLWNSGSWPVIRRWWLTLAEVQLQFMGLYQCSRSHVLNSTVRVYTQGLEYGGCSVRAINICGNVALVKFSVYR